MGYSDVFPEVSMRYLLAIGLTTEEEYRANALSERIRSLTQNNVGARPEDKPYVSGEVHIVEPDRWVSQGLWGHRIMPALNAKRRGKLQEQLKCAGVDRIEVIRKMDKYPDADDIVDHPYEVWHLNPVEQAFVAGGNASITIGDGPVSRWYKRRMIRMHLDRLQQDLQRGHGDISDRREYPLMAEICGGCVAALQGGIAEWRRLVYRNAKKSLKRGCYLRTVLPNATAFAMQIRANRHDIIEALLASDLIAADSFPAAELPAAA
ncbi:MAG: hypothetical protein KGJ78_19075 [Alphaproteobacteria bacterium]|nr:hypothetical protein [Alphaproteobacteria bacterium]